MVKRSWKSLLAGAAMLCSLAAVNVANADDIYVAGGANAHVQQVFANNGTPAVQLMSMQCGDDACGDITCGEDLGCGEGCGGDDGGEIVVGGWVQMGYHSGVVPNSTNRNDAGSFNSHPHRFNLHQGWLYMEKVADGSDGLDWGFRIDAMYGVDAGDTQSFGNNPGRWDNGGSFARGGGYGFAIPQLYAEVAAGDWSIKAGHFYTLIGYEVVTAPDNFFYSHALTMFNSEPFTHTGVLATYSASDDLTLYGGWTAGWDTGFDSVNGGSNFLGGFSVPVGENAAFTYITTLGNFGAITGGGTDYSHSLLLDVSLDDDTNLVLQSDYKNANTEDVGVNAYLIRSISDKIGVGVRSEWWKTNGSSQYATTAGVNIKPTDNLIFRPEIRHDWMIPAGGSQTTFGMDMILTF